MDRGAPKAPPIHSGEQRLFSRIWADRDAQTQFLRGFTADGRVFLRGHKNIAKIP
jgi:hypothetical protein